MAYDNTNRGSIWKNKKKEKDTHPDFTGSVNVEGVEFWVNAWRRKDDAKPDAPALTFTVRPKEARADHQNERPAPRPPDFVRKSSAGMGRDDDDLIPF
jgi:hypothetical protein